MIDQRTFFLILHLAGMATGMGAAVVSDLTFFVSIRAGKVSATGMKFLALGSRTVWLGLLVMIISGGLLVSLAPDYYLHSAKFLAKMTIVAVIAVNGLAFHFIHLPRMRRQEPLGLSLLASGAISSVSWLSALFLGAVPGLSYSYWEITVCYVVIVSAAIGSAALLRRPLRL